MDGLDCSSPGGEVSAALEDEAVLRDALKSPVTVRRDHGVDIPSPQSENVAAAGSGSEGA